MAVDPARAELRNTLIVLAANGLAYVGSPPKPRVRVQEVSPNPQNVRTVVLLDCPTVSATWRVIHVDSGKPAVVVKDPAPAPHALVVTVVKDNAVWVVSSTKANRSRTCKP